MQFWFAFGSLISFLLYLQEKEGTEKSHVILAVCCILFVCSISTMLLRYLHGKPLDQ